MTRRKQHCPKRMKWEGGEGEEPPAGYQEDDGGCPEDDEDEEEEEEEGVSGGSSGSPPRSPIPSNTDAEQDAVNERLPLRETISPSKMSSRGSPRSESSLPPYEVPLMATVSPVRSPPSSDVLDFSTKRPASPACSPPAAMNLSSNNEDSPIDLTIRSKKIKLEPSSMSPSNDLYARMSRPWAQYSTPAIRPISRGEIMTPPSEPVHMWNGKHGKISYGSFPSVASDATKALEKMCELSKLQDEPRSVLAPSSGRHSAWQSHWLNKGADQTKDVLKCVWCKMSFPTLQAMSTHMAETKHGTAAAQSLQPPPPPPPPPVSTSSGHKNDLNMLIKETMPLPRKLVRGQDVWLGKGAEQTRQILKCMWCGQSFRSLQEMTTHMQQTQHYTNIISQEQIISWKSADENKSSGGGSSSNSAAVSTSSPASSVNASANHVSAVLTCKVCDQAFNSLKELSVHMVKNSHYKEHMMRSITEGSNRRRQTREKRKKSLPVRKLLELERAQHEVKNGDVGYQTAGFKVANDANHRLGRIICEKCGEKVDVASFMEHLRVCVTMTADQKNLLKTALMSQNAMSATESGREKRPKKDDRSQAAADLSANNKPAASTTSASSPSVLNAIEKLIEKSFDSRLRYGTSAAGATIGESILKRLGIDESVDATKPIMDAQAMNLLRSYQSLGRHDRSGSESSSMSPELAAMRSDSTTPDRKYEPDYQRMRSVTPKSTPERHHSPKSSGKNHVGGHETEIKSEPAAGDGFDHVKKEYADEDDGGSSAAGKSPAEQRAASRDSAEVSAVDETNGSSRGPTPTDVKSPPSPAGSDRSTAAAENCGKRTPASSSLGALSSMFESLTSAANGGGGGLSTANGESNNGGKGGGGGGGGGSSHPLAALQKLCDKTENHHHPHHHRPSSRSSSNASATNGTAGPAQSMSPPASAVAGTAPGAILAFSWACNDAVVTADSIMKCAFCDTPFISKGAYRHHLSKVHFVKEGITPEPIMLKPAAASSGSGHLQQLQQSSSSSSPAVHSPSPSPSSSSQNKSSPNHNNNSSINNNNNNNNGSPSTSTAGGAKSPETKNGGYDESPHSKFLKYTELAKQLSSKYV